MKQIFLTLAICHITLSCLAQTDSSSPAPQWDLKLNAGTSHTFVPDFENTILVVPDGVVVPFHYHPSNSLGTPPLQSKSPVTSQSLLGWFTEVEAIYRLPKNYALSFSIGLKQLHFDTRTTISHSGHPNLVAPLNLDDIDPEFGETRLMYLTVSPLSLSRTFLKEKLTVQLGPSFNIPVKEEFNNVLLVYEDPETVESGRPDQMYFDPISKANDLMVGCHAAVSYRILEQLHVRVSAQFLNSAIFDEAGSFDQTVENVYPTMIQFGVSFLPLHLGN